MPYCKKEKNVSDCDQVPDILDIQYYNHYWQVKETKHSTIYLYSAFLDIRKIILELKPLTF